MIFLGVKVPRMAYYGHTHDDATPGPALYPGNYCVEITGKEFVYPWGKKVRNIFFTGPHQDPQSYEIPYGC